MKKISSALYAGIICALLLFSTGANAQDEKIDSYFKNNGVVLLANCAHPFNTFQGGTYTIADQYVIVDIAYEDGIRTELRIDRNGFGFSRVTVLYDNDYATPFALVKVVADIVLKQYQNSDAENEWIRSLENTLNKQLRNWSGTDWASLLVNLDYYSN